jgi:hypothetical protein
VPNETTYLLAITLHSSSSKKLVHFSLCRFAYPNISCKWNHTIRSYVTGFCYLACFQDSSMSCIVLVFYSFCCQITIFHISLCYICDLKLLGSRDPPASASYVAGGTSVPTMPRLFIHLPWWALDCFYFLDIQIILLRTFVYKFLCGHGFLFH